MNGDSNLDMSGSPWYREFWAWFVFTPLIIVIIASVITVTIAFTSSDDVVIDSYYKEGKALNQDFGPQDQAQVLNVQAELTLNKRDSSLNLRLNQRVTKNLRLTLTLSHPAKAEKDQIYRLPELSDDQVQQLPLLLTIPLTALPENRWYLRLSAFDEYSKKEFWRIQSEVDFSQFESTPLQ